MKNIRSIFFAFGLCAVLFCAHQNASAQNWQYDPPPGEAIQGKIISSVYKGIVTERWVWTNKCLFLYSYEPSSKKWRFVSTQYCAPTDIRILNVLEVNKGGKTFLIIVLSDGTVIQYDIFSREQLLGKINLNANESPRKLVGDALYSLTTQNVYVSRDTAKTWTIDTVGLSGAAQDIAVDSQQFVYAVGYNGLYRQHPDSNIWHAMTLPTRASWNRIFVDHQDRIYIGGAFSGHSLVYHSSNGGASWIPDTAGLGGESIFGFGEDMYANVYAITAASSSASGGDKIFRFNGSMWTRIDAPLTVASADSFYRPEIFTDIGGDSVLFATSIYGVFTSTDQGTTWTESNEGIPADNVYGLIRANPNHMLVSTNIGVFRKTASDTVWQRTYPQAGYLGGQSLFTDNSGAIYTLGPLVVKPDVSTNPYPPRMTMKSTNGGVNWQADTLGLAALSTIFTYLFFVDETGAQHLATYGAGATPSSIYVKFPGQPWAGDTAGFATNHFAPQAFGSDRRGSLWMSLGAQTIPTLWRRAVTGGAWSPDTTGLQSAILNSFAAAKNGVVYAGGFDGVYRRQGSGWSKLPPPSGLFTTTPAYSVSVDSSGALIAGFQHFDVNYNSIGDGVFATTDDGAHWTNLQHVDTTTFRQFVSYGDTTYGLSYVDGVFVFNTSASSAVRTASVVPKIIGVYPNPFIASTRINITLPEHGTMTVAVYDMLGQKIQSFVRDGSDAGEQAFIWDAHNLAPGVYWCEVKALGRIDRLPLVLER